MRDVAIAPAHTSSDYYDGWSYQGGAFHQAFKQSWPLTSIGLFMESLRDGRVVETSAGEGE